MKVKLSPSIFFIMLNLALVGCGTTQTAENCQELDWYEIGRTDGLKGITDDNRRTVKSVCIDTDQSLSEAIYNNGFDNGISQFCSFEVGFELGYNDETKSAEQCPPLLKDEFISGMAQGRQVAKLENEEHSITTKLELLKGKISNENSNTLRRGLLHGERIELEEKQTNLRRQIASLKVPANNSGTR